MEEMLIHADSFPKFNPLRVAPVLHLVRSNIVGTGVVKNLPPLNVGKNFHTDFPLYIRTKDGSRWILINDNGDDQSQWLYQLAHEYMHYYIDVCNRDKPSVCHWFEETLCCLSTLIRLFEYAQAYPQKALLTNEPKEEFPQNILESHRLQAQMILPDVVFQTFGAKLLLHNLPMVRSDERSVYGFYNAIAVRMMPLFVQNRNLWRIVRYLRSPEFGKYSFYSYIDELIWMSAKEHIYCLSELIELKKILLPYC